MDSNHAILKYQTFRPQGAFVSGYINMHVYKVTYDNQSMTHFSNISSKLFSSKQFI